MPDLVTNTAVLPIGESTAAFVSGLLAGERACRGTGRGRRVSGCYRQAIMVLRWLLDGTRVAQLALDNQVSGSRAYRYLHEAIDVLAAAAPGLHGALLAARTAGYHHVASDGGSIRVRVNPTAQTVRFPTDEERAQAVLGAAGTHPDGIELPPHGWAIHRNLNR